jgi:hypothetical protein
MKMLADYVGCQSRRDLRPARSRAAVSLPGERQRIGAITTGKPRAEQLPGLVGTCDARGIMTRASDVDWSAAAWRLELAVEALERDGLVIDRDLADAAIAQCRRYAADGESPGEFLPPNDPLLDLACRHDLSLDWIIIGDPRRR